MCQVVPLLNDTATVAVVIFAALPVAGALR
jgi:hypothetical protein